MIQKSCECGSAIKLAAIDEDSVEVKDTLSIWDSYHYGHEEVDPHVSTRIRSEERKRIDARIHS